MLIRVKVSVIRGRGGDSVAIFCLLVMGGVRVRGIRGVRSVWAILVSDGQS